MFKFIKEIIGIDVSLEERNNEAIMRYHMGQLNREELMSKLGQPPVYEVRKVDKNEPPK